MKTLAIAFLLFSLGACGGDDDGGEPDAGPSAALYEVNRKLDILFVVDDSGSMQDEQQSLAENFRQLTARLDQIAGGVPDLHIGVVSTNTGASEDLPGCGADGDDGQLRTDGNGTCAPIDGSFLSQTFTAAGPQTNFTGSLEDGFACISQLGVQGCGFESPLDAARRALDPVAGRNPGFLRNDALLVVVFLTDEDDCSATDRSIFGEPNATVDDPLGPRTSFRCFDFGVRCDPDEPRALGEKQNCVVRDDSQFLTPVAEFVAFFEQLKGPGRFVPISIHGIPEFSASGLGFEATVVANNSGGPLSGTPTLGPVCTSGSGDSVPAIRMTSLLESFPGGRATSICDANIGLAGVGTIAESVLGLACLPAGSAAPSCQVTATSPNGTSGPVAACQLATDRRCYEFVADDELCEAPALRYRSADDEALGLSVTFECGR